VPGLPEVDVAVVGRLRSLGEIVEHLREQLGGAASPQAAAGRSPAPAPNGPADAVAASAGEPGLSRQVIRAVPMPAPGLALPGLQAGPVLVTDDGAGVAGHLAGRLAEHGVAATVVREVPADARAVVFLGGLREIAGPCDARAIQREAFQVARTIAPGMAAAGGVFVTVQDTGGDFGLGGRSPDRAWLGGLAGLARTAAREWPAASVKAIDCARGGRDAAVIAADLARELTTGGSAGSVGLGGDGGRVVLESAAAAAEPGRAGRVGPESVIVVSGGARGVTAATVRSLARAHRPRLVLLGRTRLVEEPAHLAAAADEAALRGALIEQAMRSTGQAAPALISAAVAEILAVREVRGTLESVRAAGSEVRYLTVDARDGRALTAALDGVRRDWGPITGIVHGAGVVADKLIADKTDEQFDRVFDTKVGGLHALLEATAADPLTVLCTYSSVAAYFGNPGQCDYAMANEVLNHVACAQRAARPDCLVRSIGWGPWDGGMVNPDLARHFRQRDVALIALEAGADAFVAELDGTAGEVSVLLAAGCGAGPLAGPAATAVRGELHVSDRSHPELADHDIAGMPVVPIALVLEWFAAAATAAGPAAAVLHDVRVLRKIGLDHFGNGGNRLVVDGSWTSPDHCELALRLLGEADTRHYQATARPANGTGPGGGWGQPAGLRPLARTAIYDGQVLFHGPAFQAIRTLHGLAPAGAAAVLAGGRALGWRDADWRTDPAALDGGLQLAVLWAEPLLGGGSLPMGVRELRVHTPGLLDGPVHCVVRAGDVHGAEAECDIAFLDDRHTVCAELLGVRLVRRPA
jgi:NADP-dependent 3-hydroxy acid dehydrogenase YdfG